MIAAYRDLGPSLEEDFELRVQRLRELGEFWGIAGALDLEDREELDDALRKLRRGPILNGRR